jgi:hypothetical protein
MAVGTSGERADDEACRRVDTDVTIMLIKRSSDIRTSEITDKSHYLTRRQFLNAVGVATAATAAGPLSSETLAASNGAAHGKKLANVANRLRKKSRHDVISRTTMLPLHRRAC